MMAVGAIFSEEKYHLYNKITKQKNGQIRPFFYHSFLKTG